MAVSAPWQSGSGMYVDLGSGWVTVAHLLMGAVAVPRFFMGAVQKSSDMCVGGINFKSVGIYSGLSGSGKCVTVGDNCFCTNGKYVG